MRYLIPIAIKGAMVMSVKVKTKEELRKALNKQQKEIIIDNNELANEFIRKHKIEKVTFIASILVLAVICVILFPH